MLFINCLCSHLVLVCILRFAISQAAEGSGTEDASEAAEEKSNDYHGRDDLAHNRNRYSNRLRS